MSFQGFIDLDATIRLSVLVVDGSGTPVNADALPSYRVYGPSGFIESGSAALADSGSITGATNASPIVITSTAHGLTTGARVTITGVGGNEAANGTFIVTRVDADQFSLDGSSGDGTYTSGGTWNVTGLYRLTVTAQGVTGYDVGDVCQALVVYAVSSTEKGQIVSFNVS